MKSKQQSLLNLFFNEPTKPWHFDEICKTINLNRKQVLHWLNLFRKQHLIYRIKPRKKMPYYIAKYQHPNYHTKKRLFALQTLQESGLLTYLQQIKDPATIILFGSMTRADWHKESDIDLFIYGETKDLNIAKYELTLDRDIQIFSCKNQESLLKLPNPLLKNIIRGNILKGNLDFIEVKINGTV